MVQKKSDGPVFIDYTDPKPADQSAKFLRPHRDLGLKNVFFFRFIVEILITFPEKKSQKNDFAVLFFCVKRDLRIFSNQFFVGKKIFVTPIFLSGT